jgi:hypothetical protein
MSLTLSFNGGTRSAVNSANCDLWEKVFRHISTKKLTVEVRWMPSHLKDGKKVRPESVSDRDIEANDKADELARLAADLIQVPLPIATNYIHYVELTSIVQKRLATIIMNLPARVHTKKEPKIAAPREKVADLIGTSSHSISFKNNRYFCQQCHNNFRSNDPNLKLWLKAQCCKDNPHDYHDRPTKVSATIHIGNSIAHHSHELFMYRGLIYCNKCGGYGQSKLRLLSSQCEEPKEAGTRNLEAIAKGQMPHGVTIWPNDVEQGQLLS